MSTNGTLIQRGRCYRLSNTDVSVAAVDIKGSQISGPMIIGGNIDHDVQVSMPAERACLPSRDSVPTLGKSDRDYLATLGLENQPEQEKLANASVSVRKAVRSALLGHLVRKEVSSALKNKSCRKTVCLGIVAMEHDMSILGIDTKSRKMIYSYKDGNMDQLDSLLGMRWDVSPIDKTHFRFVTQVVFKVKDLMLSMGVYCAICRSCFSDSYRSEIQNKDMKECIEEEDHSSDLEL